MSQARKVVVTGSVHVDHVLRVAALPREGETVLASEAASGFGGKGANQAVAARAAGAAVVFVAVVGRDDDGERAIADLSELGIDASRVTRHPQLATGAAFVAVDAHGANSIIVAPGANAAWSDDEVKAAVASIDETSIVVVQGEIPETAITALLTGARARGAFVVLNLAPFIALDESALRSVDLLIVNESEATSLVGLTIDGSEHLARAVARAVGTDVVLTLGAAGSIHVSAGAVTSVPAVHVSHVVDTTGAGDVFVGTLAAALSGGLDVQEGMARASAAAARSVGRVGAQRELV